ncbi:PTS lactose/cellobiose transporter subunit IIA [[Eubacterium] hominis]|uniref:PTS lactose/cellobiose transporter subunit IIA n=1 Tax=[Eubacterium] hominis TaxID=2764325 RepID=UPI003A4E305C
MDENNPLIPVSMSIIMSAGNARTKANEALDSIASFDFVIAKEKIKEAREDITKAHQCQTEIIQAEATGQHYESCLLFTHAQDTLMTIMSEVNLTEKMILIFESFYQNK